MNRPNFLRNAWIKYVIHTGVFSIFGGCIVGIIGIILSKAKVSHLSAMSFVALGFAIFLFLLYVLTTILPNYVFYLKLLKSNKKQHIIDNIEKHGMHFLIHKLWFIWPREINKKTNAE